MRHGLSLTRPVSPPTPLKPRQLKLMRTSITYPLARKHWQRRETTHGPSPRASNNFQPSQKVASSTLNRSVRPKPLVTVGWCIIYVRCSRCLPLSTPTPPRLALDQLPTNLLSSPPPPSRQLNQGLTRATNIKVSSVTAILDSSLHFVVCPVMTGQKFKLRGLGSTMTRVLNPQVRG